MNTSRSRPSRTGAHSPGATEIARLIGATRARALPTRRSDRTPAARDRRIRPETAAGFCWTPIPFLIGRQGDNHLVLRDNRASRSHARIVSENGNYFVEDLNSRHGVYVNGQRIKRHKLAASDRIDFGFQDSYRLVFTLGRRRNTSLHGAVFRAGGYGAPVIFLNCDPWSKSRARSRVRFPQTTFWRPWWMLHSRSPARNGASCCCARATL